MNRRNHLKEDPILLELFDKMKRLYEELGAAFMNEFHRLPGFSDLLIDRWEKAQKLGWGTGTSVYDNSLIIGDVHVGRECWVGPNTVLDGSGGLVIGDYCTISTGVQIYTHDNVKQTLTSKRAAIERAPTKIGSNVYIGPNVVISKGCEIGNSVVIGANSFVKDNIPDKAIFAGNPAKKIGAVEISDNNEVIFNYI
ncbi:MULTISPECIES: acyltransferase [Olivibacter]|uniref:Acyltransferase n=1 Tax=Olivibacter jilunii TaxID=985016 RepID=A0ABW6B9S0_9SPHI|nr:acyltransferase [Olivibacter sp. UJ_SKK_5.1]MDX3912652.1 acyltransferase [Pseudosphingobacterium sp.]